MSQETQIAEGQLKMKNNSSFKFLIFVVIAGIGATVAYAMHKASADFQALWILGIAVVLASVVSSATQVANQKREVRCQATYTDRDLMEANMAKAVLGVPERPRLLA